MILNSSRCDSVVVVVVDMVCLSLLDQNQVVLGMLFLNSNLRDLVDVVCRFSSLSFLYQIVIAVIFQQPRAGTESSRDVIIRCGVS